MPDSMQIRLQNFLHDRKSNLRPEEKENPLDLVKAKEHGIVHSFEWLGQTLLFDASTSSLFRIDFDPTNTEELLDFTEDEFQEFKRSGYFQSAPVPVHPDTRLFKSLCLMITRECNFNCAYCFEGNTRISTESLQVETAVEALRWIGHLSPNRKKIEADFFGGEPLLHYQHVKEIILRAKDLSKETGKQYLFSLTTNASLLNPERLAFFNEHDISLIVSLDGDETTHNHFRRYSNQKGTFAHVWPAIQQLMQSREAGYYIRGTYTHQTLSFADQVIWMASQGIRKISYEPVVSPDPSIGIQPEDLSMLRKEYEKLAQWVVQEKQRDPSFSFYHFEVDLENGVCADKLMTSCGAGVEYLSLAPDGKVYPCHQFDGQPEYCLGTVHDKSLDHQQIEFFRQVTHLSGKQVCRNCWAKYLCGGGCIANNLVMNQSMTKPYEIACEIQKMRLEAALYVQGQLSYLNNNDNGQ